MFCSGFWHLMSIIDWYSSFREGTTAAVQNFGTSGSVSYIILGNTFWAILCCKLQRAYLSPSLSSLLLLSCVNRMINLNDELNSEKSKYQQVSFCKSAFIFRYPCSVFFTHFWFLPALHICNPSDFQPRNHVSWGFNGFSWTNEGFRYCFEQLQQQLNAVYSQEQNGKREEVAWKRR